jgi:hypothetical protein
MSNEMGSNEGLSAIELSILQSIPKAKDIGSLAKEVKVPPATLGIEIAKLQVRGYISDDGTLSEKGLKAIENE